MAKPKTAYLCAECGASALQWFGSCPSCGAAGTPDALLRLAWDDPTSATARQTVVVSYAKQTVDGELQLRRITCVGSAAPTVLVLVHNLDAATPAKVTCLLPSGRVTTPSWPSTESLLGAPLTVSGIQKERQAPSQSTIPDFS